MRRLLLPSQRMLRGPSSSWRPSGQSPHHAFLQKAISEQNPRLRKMQQELTFLQRLLRKQQSNNPRSAMPEHPQETWHKKKRKSLEEESILGGWDEKAESTHTIKPSPRLLPVSLTHLLSDGFNRGAHTTPAHLLSSSEGNWTSWKNSRQLWSFKCSSYKL